MTTSSILFCAMATAMLTPAVEGEEIGDWPEQPAKRIAEAGTDGGGLFLYGTVLYCGSGTELLAFDVSVADSPKLLARVGGIGRARQIVAKDGIVYAAARETGVWVIDMRRPADAKVVTRFDTIELATGLSLSGNVLFVSQRNNGIEFVHIADFRHPMHVDIRKTPESQSSAYANGWLYSGEWGAGQVTVFDVHDLSAVRECGRVSLRGYGDGIAVRGNRLFAATGHHRKDKSKTQEENFGLGHGLEIFDISSPSNPCFLSRIDFPRFFHGGMDWWTVRVSADGKTAFVADTYNGLFAVDVTDAGQPKVLGRLVVHGMTDAQSNASVSYLAVGSNVVYFTASDYGLGVVRCKRANRSPVASEMTPTRADFRRSYATADYSHFAAWQPPERVQVRGAAAWGNFLYVACGTAGLWALRVDESGNLQPVRRLAARCCADVAVRDGRLYAAEDFDGVAVYDLSDPLSPRELARSKSFAGAGIGSALWVTAPAGKYIVVSNRSYYHVLNALTLEATGAAFRHCPGWGRYVAEDTVGGRYLALHGCNGGFGWIDLGGERPIEIGFSSANKCGQDDNACAFRGDRLLRMSRGTLQLVAPAERTDKPWTGVELPDRCSGYPSWDGGNRLALTSRIARKVALLDVTDVARPRVLWNEKLLGHPDRSFFWQNRLVIPCGYQGLLIER